MYFLNIRPPGSEKYYDKVVDSINFRYGLSDPRNNMRKREVWKTNYIEKLDAEARRHAYDKPVAFDELLTLRVQGFVKEKRKKGLEVKRPDIIAHLKEQGLEEILQQFRGLIQDFGRER